MFDFSFLVKRSTGQIKRARGTAAPIISACAWRRVCWRQLSPSLPCHLRADVMDSGREGATREGRQTVAAINYDDFEVQGQQHPTPRGG